MKALVTYFSLFVGLSLFGQDSPIDVDLNIGETNGVVQLAWQMRAGQTCNGIDILRSTDGTNFSAIGDIQGVCGSPTEAVNYDFTDNNPQKNSTNYYKLILGLLGESNVVSIEVIDISGGFQVRPNPMTDRGRIFFKNDEGEMAVLTVTDLTGKTILERQTRGEVFEMDVRSLQAGTYPFTIRSTNDAVNVKGKLVVSD